MFSWVGYSNLLSKINQTFLNYCKNVKNTVGAVEISHDHFAGEGGCKAEAKIWSRAI